MSTKAPQKINTLQKEKVTNKNLTVDCGKEQKVLLKGTFFTRFNDQRNGGGCKNF